MAKLSRKKIKATRKVWNLDQKLKTAIRKVWAFSPHRRNCMKAAYDADSDEWFCAICGRKTERASADHIRPVGLATDWNEYIRMMFFGDLQCLCKPCHKEKTKKDLKEIKRVNTKSKTS
jgi:5-methylcytosine-specific restriction endonuclease McrA